MWYNFGIVGLQLLNFEDFEMFITKIDLIISYHSYLPSRPAPVSHVLDAFGSENYLLFNHQAFLQNSSADLLTDHPEVCLV
jgi:hypothetical protein